MNYSHQKIVIILITTLFIGSSFLSVQAHLDTPTLPESQIYRCGCIFPPDTIIPDVHPTNIDDIPPEWDWRDATYKGQTGNWITPVKKQGNCGSCWAFATVGIIEAMVNIQKGHPDIDLDLSEQQLLSCVSGSTCRGGSAIATLKYLQESRGIILESCFPYEGIDENGCDADDCNYDPVLCEHKCEDWMDNAILVSDTGYYSNPSDRLIRHIIIEQGPIVTTMKVYSDFNNYRRGIYENPTGSFIGNHLVTIVGYNVSENYYIVKNSWGTRWGEDGYFRIRAGASSFGLYTGHVSIDPQSLNFPPIADAGGLQHASINQNIKFDSTSTYDIDDDITSYHWDFGDQTTSTEPNPKHSYSSKGIYNVTLTVTDSMNKQSTSNTASFIDLWSIGDSWTYDANFTIIPEHQSELSIMGDGSISNLKTQVTGETDDTFELSISGKTEGSILLTYDVQNTPFDFKISTNIKNINMDGTLHITKAGFGIKESTYHLHGRIKLLIVMPFIPIPLPFFVPIDILVAKTYDTPQTLLGTYPSIGNSWTVPAGNSSTTTTLSILFGLISKSNTVNTSIKAITLECNKEETITVNNIPYDTYQISNSLDTLKYYYSPTLNNIIKVYGSYPDSYVMQLNLKSSSL